ncbi:MAG: protein phosphatase [Planctomycetales bacterium]|nr:protein phosphatase [Planctomycetales bacterium]
MRCVEPFSLWLGGRGEMSDLSGVLALGVEAIVDLADAEPPLALPRNLIHVRLPLADGGGNPIWLMRLAVEVVERLVNGNVPTFVCCQSGMSRSPSVVALALSRVTGQSPAESLARCVGSGPSDVSPALWRELLASMR